LAEKHLEREHVAIRPKIINIFIRFGEVSQQIASHIYGPTLVDKHVITFTWLKIYNDIYCANYHH